MNTSRSHESCLCSATGLCTRDHSSGSVGYSGSIFFPTRHWSCAKRDEPESLWKWNIQCLLYMCLQCSLCTRISFITRKPAIRSCLLQEALCVVQRERKTFSFPKAPTSSFTRKFSPSADNISIKRPMNKIKVDPREQFLFASMAYRQWLAYVF